ncbi:sigma factor-like helix-turn-helix DNA-binding protein [Enhygromyxa salina]|uniref:sigma factor-like helix-turn-helix DNA-binding protein n=1 Tax=Enhygromyxa salina TaxID=215803 RepID=UPI0011B24AC4|nr:sigma factor-like helix-turn-helix DNA-binding protein [Enhygromyxa salina]
MDRTHLIQAARDGQVQARNALGRWLAEELMTFFSYGYSVAERDELTQETMREIMAKLVTHAPEQPDAFLDWVLSFAGTSACALVPARPSCAPASRRHAGSWSRSYARNSSSSSSSATWFSCQTSIARRSCIVRLSLLGRDNAQIAAELGIPYNTVCSRLGRGRAQVLCAARAAAGDVQAPVRALP